MDYQGILNREITYKRYNPIITHHIVNMLLPSTNRFRQKTGPFDNYYYYTTLLL